MKVLLIASGVAVATGLICPSAVAPAAETPVTAVTADSGKIISVRPAALDAIKSAVIVDEPYMIKKGSKRATYKVAEVFKSIDAKVSVDLSQYDTVTLEQVNWPLDEFMIMIEGRVEITDKRGHTQVYGPGDAFVMPKGFTGTWKQLGSIKKISVSYNP